MAWLTDVLSTIGTGLSGAAVATAIYAGAAAVNKDATKEAKHDIAQFIKGFRDALDISLIVRHISHIFEIIFGDKHLSKRCIFRSIFMTFLFFTIVFFIILLNRPEGLSREAARSIPGFQLLVGWQKLSTEILFYISIMCVISIIPDFLVLWKSRILLRLLRPRSSLRYLVAL